jgi:hypothetical protein
MQNFAEVIMDISIVVDDEDAPVRLIVWGGVHNFSRRNSS